MRGKKVGHTKICFYRSLDSLLATKAATKAQWIYSPLGNSLGCESIPPHSYWVGSSSNYFPNSLSLLLPLRKQSATCTNFPRLTTRLGAPQVTPSRLGAKTPRVTNVKHKISTKLKCSRFAVLSSAFTLSLTQIQFKDIIRITQSHKERLGRAQQGYQTFLGWPASSIVMPGTAAYQGEGSRV
jgi:hypothetical protein